MRDLAWKYIRLNKNKLRYKIATIIKKEKDEAKRQPTI